MWVVRKTRQGARPDMQQGERIHGGLFHVFIFPLCGVETYFIPVIIIK